jgi:hypothetical protein
MFEMLKKKFWANFQRIIELFTQKIVTKLSKIWVWDPGSGIRKKTYSASRIQGLKKAPDLGSGPATLITISHPLFSELSTNVLLSGCHYESHVAYMSKKS